MRRPLSIAVLFAVLLAAAMLPPAAQGQRSMGFRGGSAPRGHVSPGFSGHPGFAARPAPVSGFRPAPAFARRPVVGSRFVSPRNRVFNNRIFLGNTRIGFRNRFHHHRRFFFNNGCFNAFDPFFCGNPFFGNGFVSPFGFFDPFFFDSSFAAPVQEQQPVVVEGNSGNSQLAAEVQELSDEIQSMRDEERTREEARRNVPASSATNLEPPTILVFRDGHQISVKNYAITGGTIWVLDEHAAKKYSLSDFDPSATEQANAKNGVDFKLPQ